MKILGRAFRSQGSFCISGQIIAIQQTARHNGMLAQQSRAKKGKAGNGRKSLSQSIARNNNTATQDDENISINLILAILSTGIMAFIGILTETLTNVLFPGLMAEFHVDTSTVQWLTTGYLLTVALVTPLSSYFKRKLKLRTIFLTAIVLCITGCLMAACTLNFPMLMTARILQGSGHGNRASVDVQYHS